MIEISIRFFASLAEKIGERETTVLLEDKSSVLDLFNKLKQKYGESFQHIIFQSDGNIKKTHTILLNEKSIHEQNIKEIQLKNDDIIAFLPPVSGGY